MQFTYITYDADAATVRAFGMRVYVFSGDSARCGGRHGSPAAGEEVEPRAAVRVKAHGARRHPQHDHRYVCI